MHQFYLCLCLQSIMSKCTGIYSSQFFLLLCIPQFAFHAVCIYQFLFFRNICGWKIHLPVWCLAGSLTKADRELIVVATSIHNKCLYCVVSHSALHRIYSKKPTLSDQVPTLQSFTTVVFFQYIFLWVPDITSFHSKIIHFPLHDRV